MSAQCQSSSPQPPHREAEQTSDSAAEYGTEIPDSWQLSPEQRAFTDLFDEDDEGQKS